MDGSEKPLNVRVAEKLGARLRQTEAFEFICDEWGDYLEAGEGWWVEQRPHGSWFRVPDFTTDWSATGPLLERLKIHVWPWDADTGWGASSRLGPMVENEFHWTDDRWRQGPLEAYGETPLLAICNLVLALPDEIVRG